MVLWFIVVTSQEMSRLHVFFMYRYKFYRNQTGRHTNNSGPGPANNADEDDDDEIMVYEQPDDATPVRLNESRHFQQRGRRSTGSGDRNDQRQSRSRSGGRAAEGSFVGEKENMSKEDQAYGSDVQETCR